MTGVKQITPVKFSIICEDVKNRLVNINRSEFDQETFYYAIYWIVCMELNEVLKLDFKGDGTRVDYFKRQLQKVIDKKQVETFDVVRIASSIVDEAAMLTYRKAA